MRSRLLLASVVALSGSGAASGAEPAAAPGAVQVWNVERWQTVSAGDFAGANPEMKALKPIELLGTRNGVASGCVVVARDGGSIKGFKASVGELVQAGGGGSTSSPPNALSPSKGKGRIPAARVAVRFADLARIENSWLQGQRFDRLLEAAPAEVPAVDPKKFANKRFTPKNAGTFATVPVWVTVRVPADAAAGDYEGVLSIEAEALAPSPVKVPVKLKVCDWPMPEPKDFRVRTLGWMNPEALAKHYNVPLWSDKHFELMGKSMELMLELGSRQIQINVVKGYPCQDNADTMIKWIKQPDGSYKYDFTIFDKYCDLVEKKIGKPFPIRLNIWYGPVGNGRKPVLVLDPATGAVSELVQPAPATDYGSEEDRKFWKPVFDEMRARLEKRGSTGSPHEALSSSKGGWFDGTGCNWILYCGLNIPPKLVDMVKEFWPERGWTEIEHGFFSAIPTSQKGVTVPIFVQSTVWREGSLDAYMNWKSGPYPRKYAGKFVPGTAFCSQARDQLREDSPLLLWTLRTKHEEMILKGHDGIDMVGADMFTIKDHRGRWAPGEWSYAAQGPRYRGMAILGAGDEGPIGSERFEAMREGVQLCEAMVFIQKAIEGKKLSGDLEVKANKVLDDRAKAFAACVRDDDPNGKYRRWNFHVDDYAKGSLQRDGELYAAAAEVGKLVAGK